MNSEAKAQSRSTTPQLPFPASPRVAPWIRELSELYRDELPELHFPEVDAQRLGDLLERVDAHAIEVAQARATLEAAERALAEGHADLTRAARRAHGYATVFAQDREQLLARLEKMRPSAPKKRGAAKKRRAKSAPVKAQGEPASTRAA